MLSYSRQTIEQDDIDAVVRVLQSDFLTNGPEVSELEKEIANYCGSQYAVVCANGTAALHLAYMALDLKPGESIATSAITFVASANAALYCGAEVEFTDVQGQTASMDPASLSSILERSSGKVRAVVPVHFGGGCADIIEISRIAKARGIKVVEDACHAIGSSYLDENGTQVRVGACRHSDMAAFSFHPLKHITSGEGGAVTTNDPQLYRRLLLLRSHGIERKSENWKIQDQGISQGKTNPWYHEMQILGFNYRLTDIQCALGRSQLRKLDRFIQTRRHIADLYRTVLAETNSLAKPLFANWNDGNSYHLFPVLIPFEDRGTTRAQVMSQLLEAGIPTQVHYIPVYRQPYYRARYDYLPERFPMAEAYYAQALSLPIHPTLSDKDVVFTVSTLNGLL